MNHKPTEEQERIFHFIKKRPENILIKAYAGAGKTTTIVEAVKLLPKDKSIMFLAFNKHIQEELKTKLPEHVRCYTTYGLGTSAIKRKYGDKIQFDEFKADKIIVKKSKNWDLHDEFKDDKEIEFYLENIKKLVNLCRLTLTVKPEYIPYICERYDIPINKPKDIKRVLKVLDEMTNDRSSFDYIDMIYLPAIDSSIWMFPQDYVFVDEVQDLNRCQIKIIEKVLKRDKASGKYTGRLISVGDFHQCQPEGTKILMSDGNEKNIEDIIVGDKLVSYDRHNKGHFIGYYKNHRWGAESMYKYGVNVNDVRKRLYSGNIITISTNGKSSKYTPNHKCLVRIKKDTNYKYFLYLMEHQGLFRIGVTPIWSKDGINFNANRTKQENADKFWILKAYENKLDAFLDEQFYSVYFGIPQMIFYHRQQKGNINQTVINKFYSRFSKDVLFSNVDKILTYFNRDYDFPIWEKHTGKYFSKFHMFEVHACNILPEIMQMCIFDSNNVRLVKTHGYDRTVINATYSDIDELKINYYEGYVYSLEVNKYEVYVADGILTHNSIYGFNATDEKSFEWFEKFPNTKTLPLSVSFRCSKNVIKKAQEIVPDIKALPDAPDGVVRDGDVLTEAQSGDFVICRTTMPLVKLFFQFLTQHRKAIIKGSDIGMHLIELIGKINNIEKLITFWESELNKYREDLKADGILNPLEHSGYGALEDKVHTLLFLARISDSIPDLKYKIKTIFTDEIQGIVLSTVHKIKGLEANRVFIIRPDLLPMQNTKSWQYIQEKNLEYVAYTRAKLELIFDRNWKDDE